jgi:hypothetical protein
VRIEHGQPYTTRRIVAGGAVLAVLIAIIGALGGSGDKTPVRTSAGGTTSSTASAPEETSSTASSTTVSTSSSTTVASGTSGSKSTATGPTVTTTHPCDPSYTPCLREGIGDYDCSPTANGPNYVQGTVQVHGSDPFGLDADHDGTGCDSTDRSSPGTSPTTTRSSPATAAPTTTAAASDGVTAICKDGTPSHSQHRSGTCSGHGGVREWVNGGPPG